MKRDYDTLREMLLRIEASENTVTGKNNVENYHIWLLRDGGFIEPIVEELKRGELICEVLKITPKGYDLLDTIRDNVIWKQAKEECIEKLGYLHFQAILAIMRNKINDKLK